MFSRLLLVDHTNRKRSTTFQLDGDDLWTNGKHRQAKASYLREELIDYLRQPQFVGRNPRVWVKDTGVFVSIDELGE